MPDQTLAAVRCCQRYGRLFGSGVVVQGLLTHRKVPDCV